MGFNDKIATPSARGELTFYQAMAIWRFHPRWLMINAALTPWMIYFLWLHEWVLALVALFISTGAGLIATAEIDVLGFSRTTLGKIAFLHLYPSNLFSQAVGTIGLIWAIWTHSTLGILGAITVVFLGHLSGWDELLEEAVGSSTSRKVA